MMSKRIAQPWDIPIGEALFLARIRANLTRHQLAFRAEVHLNTISRIENGEWMPRFDVLMSLCHALNIETSKVIRKAESLRPTPEVVHQASE